MAVEQGSAEANTTTEIEHRVINHFKNQNKVVMVFGHSYGAFVLLTDLSTAKDQLFKFLGEEK